MPSPPAVSPVHVPPDVGHSLFAVEHVPKQTPLVPQFALDVHAVPSATDPPTQPCVHVEPTFGHPELIVAPVQVVPLLHVHVPHG